MSDAKIEMNDDQSTTSDSEKSGRSQGEYVLDIRKVSKAFPGVQALDNVSFNLKYGEVLALVGENGAGKSTMMKILAGVHDCDHGEIILDGEPVVINSVDKATELGIALVHQELNLCDNLTVAGNVFLGREPKNKGLFNIIDKELMNSETNRVLEMVGLRTFPTTLLRELAIGSQQLVEIAKALSINAKIVMFDEPTSSLSDHETEQLFKVIRDLSSHGVSCIYISHRLGEVKEVADRVVVLRDGKFSGCLEKNEISREAMIQLMVGREIGKLYHKNHTVSDDVCFELSKFIVPKRATQPIDITVKKGEIVVLYGLVGAGRTELLEAVFGVDKSWGGKVYISGEEVEIKQPLDAIRAGMALVPEDRKQNGLIVEMEVDNNITLPGLTDKLSKRGIIDKEQAKAISNKMIDMLNVRLYKPSQPAESLSGGNQQKVVLAKWLSMHPAILLLDEPTRGIDVKSKAEIYKLLDELASEGVAILVASSEMQEVLGIADRILVMYEGRINGELTPEHCGEEDIIKLATGSTI